MPRAVGHTEVENEPAKGGGGYESEPVDAIIAVFPERLWEWAERIAMCESTMNPAAVSWDGSSYGLMQIGSIHAYRWPTFWQDCMVPERNAVYALELVLEQGAGIWSCR